MKNLNFTIITFYQFKKNTNKHEFQIILKKFCSFHKIKGTILLADEGINGNIAGLFEAINLFKKKIHNLGFAKLEIKKSEFNFMPFNYLKIKIKNEIVTFGEKALDMEKFDGQYVDPINWNKLIAEKDTTVIDVRNIFEVQIGSFQGAINPNTKKFSEFKKFVKKSLDPDKNKKIAIFCTGGIRCEKASAYMISKGFQNINQLKGGILKYLEEIPLQNSEWSGECFVFDNRVSVQNELKQGTFELCHACRSPISIEDRSSKKYKRGISCPKCINQISKNKIDNLKERNKQIDIAKKKGLYSPYIKHTPWDFS